jgi:monomeric isocitrate dehydrogenase
MVIFHSYVKLPEANYGSSSQLKPFFTNGDLQDISLSARILANFPDYVTPAQRVEDRSTGTATDGDLWRFLDEKLIFQGLG